MGCSSREEIVEVFDALDANLDRLCELSFDVLTTPERLWALECLERASRRPRAPQHTIINQLDAQAGEQELGGTLRSALADRLRITKAEAGRRIADAEDLGERRALTGEPLAPQLSATAAAQRDGLIGDKHVEVIRSFFAHLPAEVDPGTRQAAEADLAGKAGGYRPDELATYAKRIMDWLHPDGEFSDQERARRRGIVLGKQEFDGMSRLSGLVTPSCGPPSRPCWPNWPPPARAIPTTKPRWSIRPPMKMRCAAITASQAQRYHDAFLAGIRGLLASGELGQHNGLPVSIVVSTTLQDLEAATGKGLTGGGTLVPMSDVIRWASHAHHYLAIFDHGKPWRCITPNGWPPRHSESCCTPRIVDVPSRAVTPRPTTARSITSEGWTKHPPHRHRRPHPGLRTAQPARRKRLDHPHQRQRRHRMDPAGAPGPWSTPNEYLPSPRKTPGTRRRRTRLTSSKQTHRRDMS